MGVCADWYRDNAVPYEGTWTKRARELDQWTARELPSTCLPDTGGAHANVQSTKWYAT